MSCVRGSTHFTIRYHLSSLDTKRRQHQTQVTFFRVIIYLDFISTLLKINYGTGSRCFCLNCLSQLLNDVQMLFKSCLSTRLRWKEKSTVWCRDSRETHVRYPDACTYSPNHKTLVNNFKYTTTNFVAIFRCKIDRKNLDGFGTGESVVIGTERGTKQHRLTIQMCSSGSNIVPLTRHNDFISLERFSQPSLSSPITILWHFLKTVNMFRGENGGV